MTLPSTLTDIREKVRLLVGSPSPTQLTTTAIDRAINTFVVYEFPENLRLFQLHQPYIFYTLPNVDSYAFIRNEYLTINPPVYIAGYNSFWSSSQEHFYRIYPQLQDIQQVASGTGLATSYTFTIPNAPFLRGYTTPGTSTINSNVLIAGSVTSSTSTFARDDGAGGWLDENDDPLVGTIDYVTGQATVTFNNVIPLGNVINAQTVPYVAARPQGLLFYNDTITLRPVPDQVYKVEVQGFVAPTSLISANQAPLLNEWWQYISFGAAKIILGERLDADGLAKIAPFFKEQENLILRRTIVQQTPSQSATIYTEMTGYPVQNLYRY